MKTCHIPYENAWRTGVHNLLGVCIPTEFISVQIISVTFRYSIVTFQAGREGVGLETKLITFKGLNRYFGFFPYLSAAACISEEMNLDPCWHWDIV